METVRDKFKSMLCENGMFLDDAEKVMLLSENTLTEAIDDYNFTLNTPSEDYPKIIYDILYVHIKPIAFKWITTNRPKAWYKPMFYL